MSDAMSDPVARLNAALGTFALSAPELLFDGPAYTTTRNGGWQRNWDAADG